MRHTHLTQWQGKQVVGKQNILPLLRDAIEDERKVTVAIDTSTRRHRGVIGPHRAGGRGEIISVQGVDADPGRSTSAAVATGEIIALRIEEVT